MYIGKNETPPKSIEISSATTVCALPGLLINLHVNALTLWVTLCLDYHNTDDVFPFSWQLYLSDAVQLS